VCTRLGILTLPRSGVGDVRGKGMSSAMSASSIGEFSRGPQVTIIDGVCGRLIDAKREMYALDCARLGVLTHLLPVFLIGCALVNKICRRSGLVVERL
jgi:hypothetical protein